MCLYDAGTFELVNLLALLPFIYITFPTFSCVGFLYIYDIVWLFSFRQPSTPLDSLPGYVLNLKIFIPRHFPAERYSIPFPCRRYYIDFDYAPSDIFLFGEFIILYSRMKMII